MTSHLPSRWQEILRREAADNVGTVLAHAKEQPAHTRVPRWTVPALVVGIASVSLLNVIGGTAQPKAINEQIRFNGDGTLTAPVATASINGNVTRSSDTPGSYSLASNCAGSLSFSPGPSFDLIADPRGTAVYMIQTAPGTPVMQGVAERVAR